MKIFLTADIVKRLCFQIKEAIGESSRQSCEAINRMAG